MKRVAYLLGAGVTQAEATVAGRGTQLLTSDLLDGIQRRLDAQPQDIRDSIANDLSIPGVDVEQLISLYESTGTANDNRAAEYLRTAFIKEICSRMNQLDSRDRFQPLLLASLFEMHKEYQDELQEEISGVVTVKYDDLAERALGLTNTDFSFGFQLKTDGGPAVEYCSRNDGIALLKLHGSLTWSNDFPPRLVDAIHDHGETCLWLPPGVEKKRDKYPFNILWGRAKETLDCKVLRVIGCSLSRNDWQLISLLHGAKRVHNFQIEYLDYHDRGKEKHNLYPYLGILPLLSLEGFRTYLASATKLKEASKEIEEFASWGNRANFNSFDEWMKFRKAQLIEMSEDLARRIAASKFINRII